jgi:hypothetical protein
MPKTNKYSDLYEEAEGSLTIQRIHIIRLPIRE